MNPLQFIEDQTEELKLTAVSQNGYAKKYINDSSEAVMAASKASKASKASLKRLKKNNENTSDTL